MLARQAYAEGPRVHLGAGAAHALGGPQVQELGWGGGARLGVELPLGRHFGLEASGSALSLSEGRAPQDVRLAPRSFGVGWGGVGSIRINAFGVWMSGGGGVMATGDQARPVVEARLGYDARIARSAWTIGPFVQYTHIFQSSDALRPEDAHVAWVGLEVSLGSKPEHAPVVIEIAKREPPPGDRDGDTIVDPQDACPEVPGMPTSDPATNGCPSDRDHDAIFDVDDACPDVPGVATNDASTNGCPATTLRMVDDRIELDDVIHFAFGSPDVSERSKPLVKKIAEYIVARGDIVAVDIQGHADEIGSEAFNLNLSRDRATSVRKLLLEYGVTADLVVHAFGEMKPRAKGHDEQHLRQNRRVEFVVTRAHENAAAVKAQSPAPDPKPQDKIHASN